jgi:hypothetical protein
MLVYYRLGGHKQDLSRPARFKFLILFGMHLNFERGGKLADKTKRGKRGKVTGGEID